MAKHIIEQNASAEQLETAEETEEMEGQSPLAPEDERDDAGDSANATEAPPRRKPSKSPPKRDELPPYKVILHNDDVNDMAHVVRTIVSLTPLTMEVAVRHMLEAHDRGKSLLLSAHKERAELYRDQFKSKSLTVTIEQA